LLLPAAMAEFFATTQRVKFGSAAGRRAARARSKKIEFTGWAPCRHSLRGPLRSAQGRKQQRTLNRCRQQLLLQPLHVAHFRAFSTSAPPNALSLPWAPATPPCVQRLGQPWTATDCDYDNLEGLFTNWCTARQQGSDL